MKLRNRLRLLAATAVAATMPILGLVAPAMHAGATTGPPEPTSYGKANLISYADSDFESGVGNWVSYTNAALTQGTGTTMLHNSALKNTVPAAGSTAIKLGTNELNTPGGTSGQTYRVGTYVSDPVPAGDTMTFALGTFNSAGVFQGWVSSTPETLSSSTGYQYLTGKITVPAGVAYSIGLRETLTGAGASDQIRYDEVTLYPDRAAMIMGARGNGTANVSNALSVWEGGNSAIGPLQDNKIFYSTTIPTSWTGSDCADLYNAGHKVTCILAFKATQTQAQFASYLAGVPADQQIIFVPHQEPENGDYTSGALFVSYFKDQATKIRAAAADAPNIMVMMDSSGSGYLNGHPGANCSYIVPPAQGNGDGGTDGYLIDYYQEQPNGTAIPTGQNPERWKNWQNCIATGSSTTAGTISRPIGLGEFGYGVTGGPGNCVGPTEATRNSSLAADLTAFQNQTDTSGAPAMVASYWWVDDSLSEGACRDWNFTPTSVTGTTWHTGVTQNGGGAN